MLAVAGKISFSVRLRTQQTTSNLPLSGQNYVLQEWHSSAGPCEALESNGSPDTGLAGVWMKKERSDARL